MPITERLDDSTAVRSWVDTIPLHYEYTAGVAGERFLRGLIEGKILAGYCEVCDEAALPARMYCVECYSPVERYVRVGPVGVVKAVTRGRAPQGSPRRSLSWSSRESRAVSFTGCWDGPGSEPE